MCRPRPSKPSDIRLKAHKILFTSSSSLIDKNIRTFLLKMNYSTASNQPLGKFMTELLSQKKSRGLQGCLLLIIDDNASSQIIEPEYKGTLKRDFSKSSLETITTNSTCTTESSKSDIFILQPPDSPLSTMGSYNDDETGNDHDDNHRYINHSFSNTTPILHFVVGPCTPYNSLDNNIFATSFLKRNEVTRISNERSNKMGQSTNLEALHPAPRKHSQSHSLDDMAILLERIDSPWSPLDRNNCLP